MKTFYITTPIYYPSDKLHIGHSYTTVAADCMARYKKMHGYDVMFLTGTDEHGQKIEKVALQKGLSPQEHVDNMAVGIKELWKLMKIENDLFIRTTDKQHNKGVQKIFKQLYDQGDIYKSSYEGLYCTPCETFFTDRQLVEGKCPDCGRAVEKVQEECYFFKLSAYGDRLIKHIQDNPEFIMPVTRQNEMINNFLKPGLEDLAVSRTSFKWGVPVEFDPGHVVYVWIDALSNYITALGYGSDNDELYKKYWPADVHLMAKEIVRFHSIIWPAMLMALNLPLPKQIFGHGWLIIDGGKMSKSKGNVVDPKVLVEKYGLDAIRYFLMREVAFGQDGNFTNEALIQRINSDLANDLGNLLSRTIGMIEKYFGGRLQEEQAPSPFDSELIELACAASGKVETHMEKLLFSDALTEIFSLIRRTNKYTDETQPWVLIKYEEKKPVLAAVMYNLAEVLRIVSVLITPFMPDTAKAIQTQLNITDSSQVTWESSKKFGLLQKEIAVNKGEILFPRIDVKKELEALELLLQDSAKEPEQKAPQQQPEPEQIITIDDFAKVNLKIGEVLECENVKGSDKLLKSQVKIGGQVRQILSGIAKYYTPEQMIGKKVVVVTNLKERKVMGHMSCGMILAASDENGNLSLISPDGVIESGATVS